jgi:uncharacterized protein YprB with RNaseH-like and TPR domain
MKCYGYLDIESAGLSRYYADLTVIGVALVQGRRCTVTQLVGDDIKDAKSPLSKAKKHPYFPVTPCLQNDTTNINFAYIKS